MKRMDLTGQRFGKLLVLGLEGGADWRVRCDCGQEKVVRGNNLKRGATQSCGCTARDWTRTPEHRQRIAAMSTGHRDLTGEVFGQLTVLGPADTVRRGERLLHQWSVRCTCGVEKVVPGTYLTACGLQSCGCWRGRPLDIGASARNQLLARYRVQAEQRGYTWDLTDAQAFELFRTACHYCGRPPRGISGGRGLNGTFTYSGIDRKDNSQGYVPGNTVPCCKECNRGKGTLTYQAFLDYLQTIQAFWNKARATQISG